MPNTANLGPPKPARRKSTLGVVCAALVLLAGGWSWSSLALALLAGAACQFWLHRFCQEGSAALLHARQAAASERQRLEDLCAVAVPVWVRQIESARTQADSEIADASQAFGEVASRCETALSCDRLGAGRAPGDDLRKQLAGGGSELGALVQALGLLHARNEQMSQEFAAQSEKLQSSAADIRQIALHTRMVAMNATIEAARAGAAGKAFAVIVADMRTLAARTAEASDQCTAQARRLDEMVRVSLDSQAKEGSDEVSVAWAQGLVRQVMDRFQDTVQTLNRSIADLAQEREGVRHDISRALVALQVQDRVSQILSHLSSEMDAMRADFASGRWRALDDAAWRQRMEARFSTPEEFENLRDPAAAVRPRASSEITYF